MWDFNQNILYSFREFYIPPRMMDGLELYIEKHVAPGGFLSAVIKNNLRQACDCADEENLRNLPAYVGFLYNEAPAGCWGSEEAFNQWITKKPREATK